MKAKIRKKGNNTDGTNRYVLEYIKDGKIINIALNPDKLVKILDASKSTHNIHT